MPERESLPLPFGVGTLAKFGELVGWGRKDVEAQARAGTITRKEIVDIGLTADIARAWRDFYMRIRVDFPGNPSASGRAELMGRILELLEESDEF